MIQSYLNKITGEAVREAALHTHGAAGPSGVDAYAWRRFCSSFQGASTDLCNANLPSHCVCGSSFSIDHAMICSHGGLTITRHNEIQDITAKCLSAVCTNVEREPMLLPLTGENIVPRSANRRDDACADIRAMGFWGYRQCPFFDIWVFHPNAQSYHYSSIQSLYRQYEQLKKREYGDRIREIENGSFTPLVFAMMGGMG